MYLYFLYAIKQQLLTIIINQIMGKCIFLCGTIRCAVHYSRNGVNSWIRIVIAVLRRNVVKPEGDIVYMVNQLKLHITISNNL